MKRRKRRYRKGKKKEPLRFTPAFKLSTGEVVLTPGVHDLHKLAEHLNLEDSIETWIVFLPKIVEGFVDQHGKFYTRREASDSVYSHDSDPLDALDLDSKGRPK